MRFLLLALFTLGLTWDSRADTLGRIVFPKDEQVIDAKRDLGARGDGRTDDTDALQKGIDLSSGLKQKTTKILYLPNGTYKLSRSLIVRNAIGPWIYGESREGVVLKLADASKGVTAVIRTHPNESGKTSADWFMRNLRNFTIDVGNNLNTDGIRYYATNSGILQNIRIKGKGKIGVNAGFLDQSGPNLVQDVHISGFEMGILTQWIWGQTLSRITIEDCRKVGLEVSATPVAVEGLVVRNTPQAVLVNMPNDWGHWSGVLALVGGDFSGGDAKKPAIVNRGVLYARDIKITGYGSGIESKTPGGSVKGLEIKEYRSHPVKKVFDASAEALRLPIEREPTLAWETDPAKWECANDHGAIAGDNKDDTAALQKAIDAAAKAGKTVVYLRGCGGGDPNWYNLEGEVRVHGSVQRVMGLGWARILGGKKGSLFIDDTSAKTVKFMHIDSFGGTPPVIESRAKTNTLVVESCGVLVRGLGTGPIFVTDCPARLDLRTAGQKVWCRQLNPEGDSDEGLVRNAGADLWILGMKCEGRGVRVATRAGGRTEVFGTFIYGPGIKKDDKRPVFDVEDASLSVLGLRELSFGGDCYQVKVREKRGKETRSLGNDREEGWIGWSMFSTQPTKSD